MSHICNCLGNQHRGDCWHVQAVEAAILKGATFTYPIEYRSRTDARKVYLIDRIPTGQER